MGYFMNIPNNVSKVSKMDDRIVKICSCVGLGILLVSCRTAPLQHNPVGVDIDRIGFPPRFTVLVSNRESKQLTIWKESNAWGWQMITVYLKELPNGRVYTLRRSPCDFTYNWPERYEIQGHMVQRIGFDLSDDYWDVPMGVHLSRFNYLIKVRLDIRQSPEATRYHVFTGQVESAWR